MISGYPTIGADPSAKESPMFEGIQQGLKTYADYLANQGKGYENLIAKAKAQYAPQTEEANLNQILANTDFTKTQNQWYGPKSQAEIALQNAQGGLYGTQNIEQQIKNKYLAQREQAEIGELGSRSKYYQMGGGRGGIAAQDENRFMNGVDLDNPQLNGDPDRLREAANVLAVGGTRLSDGTVINPMSPITKRAYDKAYRNTTTAGLITRGVSANQAEAELPVMDRYIKQGLEPYGNTFLGISSKQLKDTVSNTPESQNRLGDYIAAQQLAIDKAALQMRINGAEPGVTIIQDAMNRAKTEINAKYPMLSYAARSRALDTFGSALKEALGARNTYGTGAAGASGKQAYTYQTPATKEKQGRTRHYNLQTGSFE